LNVSTAHLLYLVFAIGGAGLYFLLPRIRHSRTAVGVVLGLAAAAAWILVLALRVVAPGGAAYFYLFSTIAVIAAVRVITHVKPVYSALYFVLVVLATAALLILLRAEFLAAALVIIYAGAVLITYLFVIMFAQQAGSPVYDRSAREPFLAVVVGFVLTAAVAGRAGDLPAPKRPTIVAAASPAPINSLPAGRLLENTEAVGGILMTRYVVALEIAGLLLLIAMIGAIALSRKRFPSEWPVPAPFSPLGQVGREAEPF